MINMYKASIQSNLMNISVIWVRDADNLSPDREWNMKKHYHAFFELHVAQDGFVNIHVDDSTLCLEKGKYLLIPPKHPHSFGTMSSDFREFVAGFYLDFSNAEADGKYIQNALRFLEPVSVMTCGPCFANYLSDCMRYVNHDAYFPSGIAINICLILMEIAKQVMPDREEPKADEGELIREVKFYIAAHLSSGLTTESVASHVHISARHLNRLLKSKLHKSVSDLIMDDKMDCIRRQLETTDMTLEHIAEMAGFTNAYNMSRAFKKREGMSPGEYRKSLRRK